MHEYSKLLHSNVAKLIFHLSTGQSSISREFHLRLENLHCNVATFLHVDFHTYYGSTNLLESKAR